MSHNGMTIEREKFMAGDHYFCVSKIKPNKGSTLCAHVSLQSRINVFYTVPQA